MVNKEDTVSSHKSAINEAVKKVQSDILSDIMTITAFDEVLISLAGAFLIPAGSCCCYGASWLRGEKKERAIRQEIENAIDAAIGMAAMKICDQVAARVRRGIEDTATEVRRVLTQEQEALSKPIQVLDEAIA